jgi:thioredoxin-related protein
MSMTRGQGRIELRRPSCGTAGRMAFALFLVVVATAARGSDRWLTSYEAALAASQESGRPVLAVFTGSDWCQHCRTLERNVLQTEAFQIWAEERVVLLMIDLPQNGISLEERKARSRICIQYGVRSFPSTVLIAPDGSQLATQAGYRGQTTATWLTSFEGHTPVRTVAVPTAKPQVHSSLDAAVETARGARRPILVMVSRPGDASATTRLASLLNDPDFESLAHENFVVAQVPAAISQQSAADAAVEELLGGDDLPPEAVEIVVTDDGHTPLFKESGTQEPRGVVSGLRRFLASRPALPGRR